MDYTNLANGTDTVPAYFQSDPCASTSQTMPPYTMYSAAGTSSLHSMDRSSSLGSQGSASNGSYNNSSSHNTHHQGSQSSHNSLTPSADTTAGTTDVGNSQSAGAAGLAPATSASTTWANTDEWDRHRELITKLYRDDGLHLRKVQKIMAEQHNFHASERMYKTRISKWSLDKNLKAADVYVMYQMAKNRSRQGKKTTFIVRGRPMDYSRVEQYLRRDPSIVNRMHGNDNFPDVPHDHAITANIICRTPSPTPTTSPAATIGSSSGTISGTMSGTASGPRHSIDAYPAYASANYLQQHHQHQPQHQHQHQNPYGRHYSQHSATSTVPIVPSQVSMPDVSATTAAMSSSYPSLTPTSAVHGEAYHFAAPTTLSAAATTTGALTSSSAAGMLTPHIMTPRTVLGSDPRSHSYAPMTGSYHPSHHGQQQHQQHQHQQHHQQHHHQTSADGQHSHYRQDSGDRYSDHTQQHQAHGHHALPVPVAQQYTQYGPVDSSVASGSAATPVTTSSMSGSGDSSAYGWIMDANPSWMSSEFR